ncbi:MAG: type III-B CRISPR module RAMP protein Cmr1 [Candidatus Electrothrix sp. AR3]|nr:type III-B CRISPR module RAMP protein Cmr1 [Candidatus Electrothrix sp. AR3]
MPMPSTLAATYEIVTPMFIGDAGQDAQTVQPASVKGALRFWWRALNWGRVFIENDGKNAEALQQLHREESKLFGRAAEEVNKKQIGGQGGFLLRVISNTPRASNLNQKKEYQNNTWQKYLLGLGLFQDGYNRKALVSGTFTIELFCRNKKIAEDMKPVLLAWGLLGGLGSRNRKGLGSVAITSLTLKKGISAKEEPVPLAEIPTNREEFTTCLAEILPAPASDETPPFTAFCQESKMLVSEEADQTAWLALAKIARIQQLFRGWGFKHLNSQKPHKVNEIRAHHSSYGDKQKDHDLVYELAGKTSSATYPKSTVFGLPRSYGLSGFDTKKEITLEPIAMSGSAPEQKNKRSRRASPLFIHIHKFPSGKSIIVQTFLPAVFLPPKDQIEVTEKRGGGRNTLHQLSVQKKTDWTVITEYLQQNAFKDWEVVL